ncbi:MAG: spermidine/putrescine ABC transporter substrate-binding protein [Firmicutes bacterium]|nr:spermidine/putrescine ABC transporter substrate-binding protein [Bacillota bacterium]
MKKIKICAAAAALLVLLAVLTSCGKTDEVLYVYNWGEYLADGSYDTMDVLAGFEEYYEELTGRTMKVYLTTFDSNEDLYAKISGGTSRYDVIFPSDYMIDRLRNEGLLLPVNIEEVCEEYGAECYYDHIGEDFRGLYYDPEDKYSVPYTYGRVGIIYNSTQVDEEDCTGWELLWNPKYAGKILQFNNSRDAFATAQYLLGYDLNTEDPAEWYACYEKLLEQKPLIQSYVMDEIYNKMESGEAAIGAYYAGDFFTMLQVNEDLRFFYPENTSIFVDSMCIPKGSQNPENAALFMNYLLSEEPAIECAEFIFYACPNDLVFENEDYQEDMGEEVMEVLYPEDLRFSAELNVNGMRNLSPETLEYIGRLWEDLKISEGLPTGVYITASVLALFIAGIIIYNVILGRRRSKWY